MNSITTERLILRRQRVDDASVFRRLWTERDPRVPAHRRLSPDGRPGIADIEAQIRATATTDAQQRLLAVVRKDGGDAIGYCGLLMDEGAPEDPELAFELLQAVHNRGYATEAAQAVVAWASGSGYRRLRATVWDWNVASRRVLEKLGFRSAGPSGAESTHGKSLLMVRPL
ncbi:GNAT family N-acetyltransferase [Ruania rhizosphaerae]|uniref:GNAT family N-acetyltransferase n=1 Tax=Ruania rhizosphaerae TaxID=1840413 RepID=UPI001358908C|nr:GNAT family N-acetyltransferase [Ruania rhizosphaerae]